MLSRSFSLLALALGLSASSALATETFKPSHQQNPSALYVSGPHVEMGDGSVLYAGGDRLVRFWPASGKVTEAPLPVPISRPAVQKMADGLLLAGNEQATDGHFRGGDTLLFVKADGSSISGKLNVGRYAAKAAQLSDTSALIVGGTIHSVDYTVSTKPAWERTQSAELIQLRNGQLEAIRVADLPGPARRGFELVALKDGRVMSLGGNPSQYSSCMECIPNTWLFDPQTRQWQDGAPMKIGRTDFSATVLPDGRVLVAGGYSTRDRNDPDDSVEIYDPKTNRWEDFPNLPAPLADHIAVWFDSAEKTTLILGGGSNNQIYQLDVAKRKWLIVGSTQRYRINSDLLTWRDAQGKPWALVFGGINNPRGQNPSPDYDLERIPLRSVQLPPTASGIFPLRRLGVALAVASDGKALLAGGRADGDSADTSTAAVDQLTIGNVPVAMPVLQHGRSDASAFWTAGTAVVLGGQQFNDGTTERQSLPAEWFDSASNSWKTVLSPKGLPLDTNDATFSQNPDGSLLQASGNRLRRLRIEQGSARYDSAPLPDLPDSRSGGQVRLLADGRIIVAGGQAQSEKIAVVFENDGAVQDKITYEGFGLLTATRRYDIYEPGKRRWHSSAPARLAGSDLSEGTVAAILDDGRVLHVGLIPNRTNAEGETIEPARVQLELSSADGRHWKTLPVPSGMDIQDVSDTRPFVQLGELFLTGRRDEQSNRQRVLWHFDSASENWVELACWSDRNESMLVVRPLPNGKQVVWVW